MDNSYINSTLLARINGDVITVMQLSKELGWKPIRESSISRVIYLASVLYSFKKNQENNPFVKDYHFSVDSTGPFYSLIDKSIAFLESHGEIDRKMDNELILSIDFIADLDILPNYKTKFEWIKTVFFILGIYGENKIYEFIIRDPQYQENIQSNSIREINIGMGNKTLLFLNQFKEAFEDSLGNEASKIDDREYIQLYFEYIFSKVIKGDVIL